MPLTSHSLSTPCRITTVSSAGNRGFMDELKPASWPSTRIAGFYILNLQPTFATCEPGFSMNCSPAIAPAWPSSTQTAGQDRNFRIMTLAFFPHLLRPLVPAQKPPGKTPPASWDGFGILKGEELMSRTGGVERAI